ncbi:hypothetical protein ABIE56_004368 [Luteibacter sp. 621]|jgi:hypothetical protein|uniref:hypothetical protein n=1 Tax=Luteibacter sp. 621 TaxID=3373916 RepID=UPI003D1DA1E2
MQRREPGKRDYGTSDAAALRSLASRGIPVPPQDRPAPRPVNVRQQPERPRRPTPSPA